MKLEDKSRKITALLQRQYSKQDYESLMDRCGSMQSGPIYNLAGSGGLEATASQSLPSPVSVLEKARAGKEPLQRDEVFVMEAIILPDERPVSFILHGQWQEFGAPWTHLNTPKIRATFHSVIPSVGRIELPGSSLPYGGTAFVVGRQLLMTNRHVAELFVKGVGNRPDQLVYRPGAAEVNMIREHGVESDPLILCRVRRVLLVHPYWDMAVFEVSGLPESLIPLRLSTESADGLGSRDAVTIGYPYFDDRNPPDVQARVFGGIYGVKRAQPGQLMVRNSVSSFDHLVQALCHNCSTLGGNSGSAVVELLSGMVVGLHFGGSYLIENYAVPVAELARDPRVADLGLKFESGDRVIRDDPWASYWERLEGVGHAVPVPVPLTGRVPEPVPSSLTFAVPLTIQVSLGRDRVPVASDNGLALEEAPRMAVPVIYDGLDQRQGYDPAFLSSEHVVPFPSLTSAGQQVAAKLEDGTIELKYHKFSVVMHERRRLALFTASNVDWRPAHRVINGKKPSRQELTGLKKGQLEQWVTDSRLPDVAQLPDVFYTKDDGAFDKGHLVRRDDVCWGDTFEDMQMANGDTYHTTNCSPQASSFNQAPQGTDNWGDLETLVQVQTKAERACVFAGPVLEEHDPVFVGKGPQGALRIQIPRSFWKVVCVLNDVSWGAYGFLLKQDLSDVPLEFAVPAKWKPYMVPLTEIAARLQGWVDLSVIIRADLGGGEEGVRMKQQLEEYVIGR